MASWLVLSTPDRALRVRASEGDNVCCSWAKQFTLTVPLSTQVYEWVPANLMLGVTIQGGVEIFLHVTETGKLRPNEPDFTFTYKSTEVGRIQFLLLK